MKKKIWMVSTVFLLVLVFSLIVSCQKKMVDATPEPVVKEEPKEEVVVEERPVISHLTEAQITKDYKVKLLVRDFFNTQKGEEQYSNRYYGYYSYLIFTHPTKYEEEQRAAAKSFLDDYSDVDKERKRRAELEPYNFAVFYAFLENEKEPKSPEDLLNNYDHNYARLLATEIEKSSEKYYTMEELAVSIVAYPVPLRKNAYIAIDLIQVISLSDKPPNVIKRIFHEFQDSVERPVRLKPDDEGNPIIILKENEGIWAFSEFFREIFGSLGELVLLL